MAGWRPRAALSARSVGFSPAGWLKHRIALTANRLLHGKTPEYTDDLVLADIRVDRNRRFGEWSGDLSGRYIEALALLPAGDSGTRVPRLTRAILESQLPDGRFGDGKLAFTPDTIELPHMALLWGNGRLLVGLLEAERAAGIALALDASRRLGDFLLSTQAVCMQPAVQKRMADKKAHGIICFTQVVEGLVLLGVRTQDAKYLRAAREIAAMLEPRRPGQHSHGYLSTLRGAMMLFEATQDRAVLDEARKRLDDLTASGDYLVYGGVPEFFGPDLARDEGCSEADLLRFALQMWRATGQGRYLDVAERCLYNAFSFNQLRTGDFGHRVLSKHGIKPNDSVGRAWWCCTMHGYRAFKDVLDAAVTPAAGVPRVNLYLPGHWSDGRAGLIIGEPVAAAGGRLRVPIRIDAGIEAIALRQPHWADAIEVRQGAARVDVHEQDGYWTLRTPAMRSITIDVLFRLRTRIETRDRRVLTVNEIGDRPIEAALHHGPWLLAVDSAMDPMFFGEPFPANVVHVPEGLRTSDVSGKADPLAVPVARLQAEYLHDGFSGLNRTMLRPIAEQTANEPGTVAFWLRLGRAPTTAQANP